jgi:two-component system cell cycle response regulator
VTIFRTGHTGAWWMYLVAGHLLLGVYYLIPVSPAGTTGQTVRVVLYCTISASAAVATFAGVRRNRPQWRRPWVFLALSQVVYAIADLTFYASHYIFEYTVYPSYADIFYLGHYPLMVAGVILLIRRRTPGLDLPSLLDAAVLAVVAGMASWLYVIGPQARLTSPVLVKIASLGYPMMDLALFVVALRLIFGAGPRPRAFVLLTCNLLGILTADTIYVLQRLDGSYHAGNFLDAIWLSANLCIGAAALHPTMARLVDRAHVKDVGLSRGRIIALCSAALAAPILMLVHDVGQSSQDVLVIAAGSALLSLLIIARLAGLVADQRKLAITDSLTGLHTRRFFEAQLPLEISRARRGDGSVAVFIIDVDRFKSINDNYGHPAGDDVLMEVAARLRAASRAGEVLARYGGEEFALLVPDAGPGRLSVIANRLRERVAEKPIPVNAGNDDIPLFVTVSVGSASFPTHGDGPDDIVVIADRALYAAKAAGRNRIAVGPEPLPAVDPDTDGAMAEFLCQVADRVDGWLHRYDHSRSVSRWAGVAAGEFGLDAPTIRVTQLAGRLHDIGKVIIPEVVLTKPGALSEEEWRLLRQHPDFGYRLARMVPGFAGVAHVIRQQHERYDGAGYPDGLRGADIRAEARILSVCVAWAAMRSNRPHQTALDENRARRELWSGRGQQFDPDVVDLFLDLHAQGSIGTLRPSGLSIQEAGFPAEFRP